MIRRVFTILSAGGLSLCVAAAIGSFIDWSYNDGPRGPFRQAGNRLWAPWQGVYVVVQHDPFGRVWQQQQESLTIAAMTPSQSIIKYKPRVFLRPRDGWRIGMFFPMRWRAIGYWSAGNLGRAEWQARSWAVFVPFWWFCLPTSVLPLIYLRRRLATRRRQQRSARGLCPSCGYDVRAHHPGQLCPECGQPVPADLSRPALSGVEPRNGDSIMSDRARADPAAR